MRPPPHVHPHLDHVLRAHAVDLGLRAGHDGGVAGDTHVRRIGSRRLYGEVGEQLDQLRLVAFGAVLIDALVTVGDDAAERGGFKYTTGIRSLRGAVFRQTTARLRIDAMPVNAA
jgi:hypothetical protein